MALSRKTFLRVLGGGIVLAAGAAMVVPRLDAMPAVAVEGWRGPAPDETDRGDGRLPGRCSRPTRTISNPGRSTFAARHDRLYVDAARLLPRPTRSRVRS